MFWATRSIFTEVGEQGWHADYFLHGRSNEVLVMDQCLLCSLCALVQERRTTPFGKCTWFLPGCPCSPLVTCHLIISPPPNFWYDWLLQIQRITEYEQRRDRLLQQLPEQTQRTINQRQKEAASVPGKLRVAACRIASVLFVGNLLSTACTSGSEKWIFPQPILNEASFRLEVDTP